MQMYNVLKRIHEPKEPCFYTILSRRDLLYLAVFRTLYSINCVSAPRLLLCTMIAYPKTIKKKLSIDQKAKLGLIQRTIPGEKKKALERDNHQCISCGTNNSLSFSHCYWHSSEVIRDETRNLYYRGCILCLKCHERIPKEPRFDYFCKQYVWGKHPDIYY